MSTLTQILTSSPYIPVVALDNPDAAADLMAAYKAADINIIELTLRKKGATTAMRNVAKEYPDSIVGAGTVFTAEQAAECIDSGASFIVSPGYSEEVHTCCEKHNVSYLPGAVTATEIQTLFVKGLNALKFFPAEASGGVTTLKALAPVFPEVHFCATGGVNTKNASEYLSLPNVLSVGMSNLAPKDLIKEEKWDEIEQIAKSIISGG